MRDRNTYLPLNISIGSALQIILCQRIQPFIGEQHFLEDGNSLIWRCNDQSGFKNQTNAR